MTWGKHYPNKINVLGILATPGQCALRDNVHLPQLSEGAYSTDSKYFDWKGLFGDLAPLNFGV